MRFANHQTVKFAKINYLDVTYNWDKNISKPFLKESNKTIQIKIHSNHPPSILRYLPILLEKRVSKTLSDKDIFNKSIETRKDDLKWSDFKEESNCIPPENNNRKRKRKRKWKVIWFSPPYSRSVKTNIAKTLLRRISKHF